MTTSGDASLGDFWNFDLIHISIIGRGSGVREKYWKWKIKRGIPTAISLLECRKTGKESSIICSGGITSGNDIIKSIRLGAELVGICGALVDINKFQFYNNCIKYFEKIIEQMKIVMLLTGSSCISDIKKTFLCKGRTCNVYERRLPLWLS